MHGSFLWWLVACGDGEPDPPDRDGKFDPTATDADGDGVAHGEDCDDGDPLVHPYADERCNGVDDDCDGSVDEEAVDEIAVFADVDADGYGGAAAGFACAPGADQVATTGDCDDHDPGAHPGAAEICNGGIDDDCDGVADDDDDATGKTDFFADADEDGFGAGKPVFVCGPVAGSVTDGSDCDDTQTAIHPGAAELCNDIDDDCDAMTTESGVVSVGDEVFGGVQEAIDAAVYPQTVSICEGTWFENLRVAHGAVLEGRGPELSILDGNGAGAVVFVETPAALTLRGLTLQHGTGELDGDDRWGGGVSAYESGDLTIENCVVADNTADYGGGIVGPYLSNTYVSSTVVRGNSATQWGGGAYFSNLAPFYETVISDSEFSENTAGKDGGGLYLIPTYDSSGEATLTDTVVDSNTATGEGGGIYSLSELTMWGVTISNNVAGSGAGASTYADVTAYNWTTVSGNTTLDDGRGGGISISATWRYGTIEGNTASYGGGVALYANGLLREVVIDGNRATVGGGGVWIDSPTTEIRESTISSNESDGTGGGIGTVAVEGSDFATLDTVTVISNVAATSGGGARVEMGLWCVDCDWGAGATENSPDDISLAWDGEEVTYDDFSTSKELVCTVDDLVCE